MAKQPIIVGATQYDNAKIAHLTQRLDNVHHAITVIVNAGALQVAQHGNINWLQDLLAHPLMRIKSGKLSALGKNVADYAIAHFPRLAWDSEQEKLVAKKYNPDHIHATHFVAVSLTERPMLDADTYNPDYCNGPVGKKIYRVQGDFELNFTDFLSFKAESKSTKEEEEVQKSIKADSAAKQLDKYLAAIDAKLFAGSPDELKAVFAKAQSLIERIAKLNAVEEAKLDPIDEAKAAELLKSGQAGKSIRAGAKVQPKAA